MDILHRLLKTAHPTKAEKKILISLLSILIILCTLTFLSHRNSKRVISSAEEVDRSQEIKYHIEQVLAVATDLETGARGYVITGDEQYLEPSRKAVATIFVHLNHLKQIVGNNSTQLAQISQLTELVDKKISVSAEIVKIRKTSGLNDAIQYMAASDSKLLMDNIRAVTDKMMNAENGRLQKEREENHANIKNFNLAFDLLLLKIAVSILTVFFILRFYFKARRKSEELLSVSKHLLESIIDNTSSVIFIKDLTGKYILINSSYENLYHINKEEIKGKTCDEIFSKEIAASIRKTDLEVIRTGKLMQFEEDIPNNNEVRHYLTVKFPLFDNDKKLYAVCGIATDITERIRMEKLITERADTFFDLFNNAPCAYHSINNDGVIIEMNDTELKWLGYTREEVIGKMHIRNLLSSESHVILDHYFPKIKEGKIGTLQNIEIVLMRKDGTTIPVEAHVTIQYDDNGEFLRTRTSLFDISVRKQAEALISQN
ncbi:MAG: CHASE3 domain-containing protein [Bacteroidia bacterium]